jgi:hypothetical protein
MYVVTHPEEVTQGHFRIGLGARHCAFEKQFNGLLSGKGEPTSGSKGNFKKAVGWKVSAGAHRGSF